MKKRILIILLIVVVIAVSGYFVYNQYLRQQLAANSAFQTEVIHRGELTAIVGATGTVRANQTTVVTWQTSGTIDQVLVAVGDSVQRDQVMARLLQSSLPQNVILAQAELVTAKRNLDDLSRSQSARAQAQLALAQAQKAATDAAKKSQSKLFQRASQNTIDNARASLILARDEVQKAEDLFDRVKSLGEDDVNYASALSRLAAARQKRDVAEANLRYAEARPDAQQVSEVDAQLALAEAKLQDAEREWERLKDGPDPDDLTAARAKVAATEATLNLARLAAPFNATVTEVNSKKGDQVSPGTVSFRLDDYSRLLVDVQITEVDINRVKVGQEVSMVFDAIPNTTYNGKVTEVGKVGTNQQGVVNFTVVIELVDADENVRPGMTAAVNVVVNQIKNALLVPNRAVRLREGQRVIYILRDGKAVVTQVEIGSSSDTESEILSGDAKEGDLVVLNPPMEIRAGGGPP